MQRASPVTIIVELYKKKKIKIISEPGNVISKVVLLTVYVIFNGVQLGGGRLPRHTTFWGDHRWNR